MNIYTQFGEKGVKMLFKVVILLLPTVHAAYCRF